MTEEPPPAEDIVFFDPPKPKTLEQRILDVIDEVRYRIRAAALILWHGQKFLDDDL